MTYWDKNNTLYIYIYIYILKLTFPITELMFRVLLTVKNLGGNLFEKKSTIIKRSFKFSTKHLSLDSTIPIDELLVETFYRFKTSELFNIQMSHFLCTDPSTWLTHQPEEDVGCKFLHFINNEDQKALGYKIIRHKDVVASFWENKALVTICICSPCILLCDGL